MKLDKRLCREIRLRVKEYVAPAIAEHPGVVELSRVWRIWSGEITKRELEKCLDGLNATKIEISGEKYYIFPAILEKTYDKNQKEIQELKEELKEKESKYARLEAELEALGSLQDSWNDGWSEVELGEFKGKVTTDKILTSISSRFAVKEKKDQSFLKNYRDTIKDKRTSLKQLESLLNDLFPYYSMLMERRARS